MAQKLTKCCCEWYLSVRRVRHSKLVYAFIHHFNLISSYVSIRVCSLSNALSGTCLYGGTAPQSSRARCWVEHGLSNGIGVLRNNLLTLPRLS